MKKYYPLIVLLFALLTGACNQREQQNVKKLSSQDIYTCSMHPQVIRHEPGDCPICGMRLVKKEVATASLNNIALESLLKPTNEFVLASLQLTEPARKSVASAVTAYGTIEYDTRASRSVSSRVAGRIEKLYVRYRYQSVSRGDKIMDIYSPELMTAQQNLLFLLKNDAENSSLIDGAKEKLLLLGMTQHELNRVIETDKPAYSVSVYSDYSGHIHEAEMEAGVGSVGMNNVPSRTEELPLREGMYVQKGETLFMIMSHQKASAALQIFPGDLALIKSGDAVTIIPDADTGKVIKGHIDFIEPFFRNNSKTLTVRVYFDNTGMLPVGSTVTATIQTQSKTAVWLPRTAVISLGMNDVVFVKSDGGFLAHRIVTGQRTGSDIQVISGLSTQDTVAENAQFLIDSESFIRTAD